MMKREKKLHEFRYKYGWTIKAEGNKKPTRGTKTFDDAFILSLDMSSIRNTNIQIHDTNGRLNPDSYF